MEEGELGPPSQEEPSEETALHYEERISSLLVTIVRLQEKMERLQQDRAREEEEEEEEEDLFFFSELGSESTTSLPRCPSLFARRPRSPSALPPAAPEEGGAEGSPKGGSGPAACKGAADSCQGLEAGRVVALQRDVPGCPPQEPEGPPCKRMAALYKERNAALRAQLQAQQELLSRSKAALAAQQQQRDRLQGKVQELQESLSRAETCSGGAPRHLWEGAQDPPSGAAQNGLHPPWGATGAQPAPTLPPSPPAELQSSLEQLHRHLEGLRGLNRRLSGALQESKADAEQLSLLLGQQESHQTSLALALRGSECCLEAYETLWALTATEQKPSSETGAEAPWAEVTEAAHPPSASGPGHRGQQAQCRHCGQGDGGPEGHAGGVPGLASPPQMPKGQLLRELHNTREALADLSTRLHLTAKAKQGLELCTHTLPAQEAACLLLIRTLQREHRDLLRAWAPDGAPHRPPPAVPNTVDRRLDRREPEALVLPVRDASARIRALKERLEGLWVDLEEKSQDCRAHEAQEMELMQDFFQAHSALLLAYQKARQKQESQVGQLETQVALMTRRQAKQRQALLQTLRQLQQHPGSTGAPTGLPQAPAPSESTLGPPGKLGVPSSSCSRK
ncbi:hypothetical protein E2320_022171 [Naja naja]|nr:hypothetical protein E2320_022171 [Naja naja]